MVGPADAIEVCNTVVPAIAMKHSQRSGWDVGRTSLKVRNPDNAPEAWETRVLQAFDERRAKGEDPDTLAYAEVIEEGGDRYYRLVARIVMPPLEKMPCLASHGGSIDPAWATRCSGAASVNRPVTPNIVPRDRGRP